MLGDDLEAKIANLSAFPISHLVGVALEDFSAASKKLHLIHLAYAQHLLGAFSGRWLVSGLL